MVGGHRPGNEEIVTSHWQPALDVSARSFQFNRMYRWRTHPFDSTSIITNELSVIDLDGRPFAHSANTSLSAIRHTHTMFIWQSACERMQSVHFENQMSKNENVYWHRLHANVHRKCATRHGKKEGKKAILNVSNHLAAAAYRLSTSVSISHALCMPIYAFGVVSPSLACRAQSQSSTHSLLFFSLSLSRIMHTFSQRRDDDGTGDTELDGNKIAKLFTSRIFYTFAERERPISNVNT